MKVRRARFEELDGATLYAILRLRSEVFVVEQTCPYLDPDGRDPEAEHWWIDDAGVIASYLRVIPEADGVSRIGRVVTSPSNRGCGLATDLMRAVLDTVDPPWRLDAQTPLVGWYEQFGFVVSGAEYLEDGIPHTPMARAMR